MAAPTPEFIKRQRGGLRAAFTTTYKEIVDQVNQGNGIDGKKLAQLQNKFQRLAEKDDEFQSSLTWENDEELTAEMESCEKYRDQLTALEYDYGKAIQEQGSVVQAGQGVSRKLPRLSLESYDLSPKTWIPFWAQFSRIHEDNQLSFSDKFQYLLISLKPGPAREMVASHPRDLASYEKAIEALHRRYGRETFLIEVYTRELLNILLAKDKLSLANLYDSITTQLRALESLGMTSEKGAFVLYPLVESCLPAELLKAWERQRRQRSLSASNSSLVEDYNPLTELLQFLEEEVRTEERISIAAEPLGDYGKPQPRVPTMVSMSTTASSQNPQKQQASSRSICCIFCDREHNSQDCVKAQSMTVEERNRIVTKASACYKCLKKGHSMKSCRGAVRCLLCGKGHYALLCRGGGNQKKDRDTSEVQANFSGSINSSPTYLKTILVDVIGQSKSRTVRALLDDGAQRSYVAQSVIDELQLQPSRTEVITHGLFGGYTQAAKEFQVFQLQLKNRLDSKLVKVDAVAQAVICHQVERPSALQDRGLMKALAEQKITLSDVGDNPPPVECLLGADVLGSILTGRLQVLGNGVTAIETQLGWSVLGTSSRRAQNMVSLCLNAVNIEDSWNLEAIGITEPVMPAGLKSQVSDAVVHLQNTIKNENGRYVLQLPWKAGHPPLSENLDVATMRLNSITAKLKRERVFEKYGDVIQDWLKEGIVEEVPDTESEANAVHYLPHRPVIKDGESSTKIRPVFDASAKRPGRASLNECLLPGDNMLQLIPHLLTQFRLGKYGVTADIKQAFLQLELEAKDRDVLRFLWWDKGKIKTYRHCRVVFGVTCSPFLLNFTLAYHLAEEAQRESPENQLLIDHLKRSFYVDDAVTSFDEPETVEKFAEVSTEVMLRGKFELRRWTSNVPPLREKDPREIVAVLGLNWNLSEDTLSLASLKNRIPVGPITKRRLLGLINAVYDPLGFVSPAMLPARLLLQEAWRGQIDWDTPLEAEQQKQYASWVSTIHVMDEISCPRHLYGGKVKDGTVSLHVFSDASQKGYGCCIYARYEGDNGLVTTRLIVAKARVAPLQNTTIPRLELLGACLGVRLYHSVTGVFGTDTPVYFWTDSTVVLAWIKEGLLWGTYVGNRVKEIRHGSDINSWRHVPGTMNPADVASRGCTMEQLSEMKWWEGPAWLTKKEEEWPPHPEVSEAPPEALLELKDKRSLGLVVIDSTNEEEFLQRVCYYFSNYRKMVRMVAWMLRLRPQRKKGSLTADEEREAEKKLAWLVQRAKDCSVVGVRTHRDAAGLVRVTSRVVAKDWETSLIVLPQHYVVELLIFYVHVRCQHAGVNTVLAKLREGFWIIRGRSFVKRILRGCVKCKRQLGHNIQPPPAKLPVERTAVEGPPFNNTGMDLFGPLYLVGGEKVWGILFTCAVFRCVRLDLVEALSTECFVRALRRFLSRNRCCYLYSDNGTNFMGLANQLEAIDWDRVSEFAAENRLIMKQAPPCAPWFGGFYERLVGVVKLSLQKTVGAASLSRDELYTLLVECEFVVNSRPLTYCSNDIAELEPLTPAHFLLEKPGVGSEMLDVVDERSLARRVQYMHRVRQQLRERFKNEYLNLLVQKDSCSRGSIEVGDVVLIECDKKRVQWPLGRVLEILPSRDGESRVCKLRTAGGELIRPVQRLFPLEVRHHDDSVLRLASDVNDEPQAGVEYLPTTERVELGVPSCDEVGDMLKNTKFTRVGRAVKVPEKLNL